MNVNSDSGSSPAKKRKVDDCRADAESNDGFFSSWFGYFSGRDNASSAASRAECNIMSRLDQMEKNIMMKMGEQLATMSSRCAELEAKCSSLEDKLESTSQSMKDQIVRLEDKVDSHQKLQEYNAMLLRNQSWEYSADVISERRWLSLGHFNDEAAYLEKAALRLKDMTIKMRRGEFPDEKEFKDGTKGKGIHFYNHGIPGPDDYSIEELLPHWKEFTAAIKQFTPAMLLVPDNCDTYFHFEDFHLNDDMFLMMKEALIGIPFTSISIEGISMGDILDIAESNTHLRKLETYFSNILSNHIERLSSVVHNHSLVELCICRSSDDPSIGNATLTSLLTCGELKLESLGMCGNGINSDVSIMLADFIATNPRLKVLDLSCNMLVDSDATLIANSLRSNTTLRELHLYGNNITDSSLAAAFWPVLCDESSLNALADSNHCCHMFGVDLLLSQLNSSKVMEENRGRKIYSLLSTRNVNDAMTNIQDFDDIDVKVLPHMLEAVQKYAKFADEDEDVVGSLSIVYEVMRKWEKVFNSYYCDM